MFSPKARRNISRIIPFSLIWLFFSIVYTFLEKGILGPLDYYPITGNPYRFQSAIAVTPISALITGTGIGMLEVLVIHHWFRRMSFSKRILFKSAIYVAVISIFLTLVIAIASMITLNKNLFSKPVWDIVWSFFFTYTYLSLLFYVASIVVVSQFYAEISDKVSLHTLRNFFTGKYHKPVEEERVFMFLDMKSSTTIAEKIGHIRYFEMLHEYFSDLSDPIIDYRGEVYQYAGDEVIVSWTLKNGIENNNCIQCFFSMKAALKTAADRYQSEFGLVPEFKAGLHLGKVTTGEIGVLKKEIVFTGDVLNTTARVQGLCNQYKVDNLVTADLKKRLNLNSHFRVEAMGECELKGRGERVELFTVREIINPG